MNTISLQARWLFPVTSPPIERGVITIRDGNIVAIGDNVLGVPAHDLGEVAILPGLINAHTHLEFSDLAQPLGEENMAFPEWIRHVIDYRIKRSSNDPSAKPASIAQGLAESQAASVAAIGEIATPTHAHSPYAQAAASLSGTTFLELLGLAPEREDELVAAAREHLANGPTGRWSLGLSPHASRSADRRSVRRLPPGRWSPGLSPHAPYTVSPRLVSAAVELAREFNAPVAMHLAESREEMELLATGGGPLADLLREIGAWHPEAVPLGSEPIDYLHLLADAPRSLVIHGNYLNEEELRFLGRHRERMTLVYCPRTHARFGHPTYPLVSALAAGVRVALGTDSRASNPDLSLFEELRHVVHRFPQVSPADLLAAATLRGAEALGLGAQLGSLEVGKQANLAIVKLGADHAEPFVRLLAADSALIPPDSGFTSIG